MRSRITAVASHEGFWEEGKPLEAMGSLREEVDEMLKVQVFKILHYFVLFFVIPTVPTPPIGLSLNR